MASPTSVETLRAWFESHGGFIHSEAKLAVGEDGLHMRNASKVSGTKFEPILRVPDDIVISHKNAETSPLISDLSAQVAPHVAAYFAFLEEVSHGESSKWYPYIACLPQSGAEIGTPLHFTKRQNKWLLGTNLLEAVPELLRVREAEFDEAIGILRSKPGFESSLPAIFRLDRYLWAAAIFSSRSFPYMGQTLGDDDSVPSLYPLADALNHHYSAKVTWSSENGNLAITTNEEIAPEREIFNNYGPKSNEQLLISYGFCLLGNPSDSVAIRMGKPPPPIHQRMKQLYPDIFTSSDWTTRESLFHVLDRNHSYDAQGQYPELTLETANYLKCIPGHLFRLLFELVKFATVGPEFYRADLKPDCRCIPSVFRRILAQLRAKFAKIREYDTELEELTPSSPQETHSVIYRNGQRAILQQAISDLTLLLRSFVLQEKLAATPSCVGILDMNSILQLQSIEDVDFHNAFSQGIEAGSKTSDLEALREAGAEDIVWGLWLAHMLQLSREESAPRTQEPLVRRLFRSLLKDYPIKEAPAPDLELLGDLRTYIDAAVESSQTLIVQYWTRLSTMGDEGLGWAIWVMSNETFEDTQTVGYAGFCIAFHDHDSENHIMATS